MNIYGYIAIGVAIVGVIGWRWLSWRHQVKARQKAYQAFADENMRTIGEAVSFGNPDLITDLHTHFADNQAHYQMLFQDGQARSARAYLSNATRRIMQTHNVAVE